MLPFRGGTEFAKAAASMCELPTCQLCAGPTRLFGIETHPRFAMTDLRTYVCDRCDEIEVLAVPLGNARAPNRR